MKHAFVYVTAPDRTVAARLARHAVDTRLAACANLVPRIESVYRWKGRVETATESALILKTRMALVPRLIAAIRKIHPYECPCIVTLPIAGGDPDFLRWIEAETAPATPRPAGPVAARRPGDDRVRRVSKGGTEGADGREGGGRGGGRGVRSWRGGLRSRRSGRGRDERGG